MCRRKCLYGGRVVIDDLFIGGNFANSIWGDNMLVAVQDGFKFALIEEVDGLEPTGFTVEIGGVRYPLLKGIKVIGTYKIKDYIRLVREEDYDKLIFRKWS